MQEAALAPMVTSGSSGLRSGDPADLLTVHGSSCHARPVYNWAGRLYGSRLTADRSERCRPHQVRSLAMPKCSIRVKRYAADGRPLVRQLSQPFLGLCCEKLGDDLWPGRATRAIGGHSRLTRLRLSSVED